MLFNQNIILQILRSSFPNEIALFIDQCIMKMDAYDLSNIFEEQIDLAIADSMEEMKVTDFCAVGKADSQTVDGAFEIQVLMDGYEKKDNREHYVWKEKKMAVFGIMFSFHAEQGVYTDIHLEYGYSQGIQE